MRIELRDESRRRIGRAVVDPALRPTRVEVGDSRFAALGFQLLPKAQSPPPTADGPPLPPREAFLNWDTALDDAGQLRKCVACGCEALFKEKAFPQVTAFVVALAFVGAIIGAMGLATNLLVLILMAVVLVLDICILVFSQRRLVCYRCRSTFHDLPIARYHRTWDRATADRHPASPLGPQPTRSRVVNPDPSSVNTNKDATESAAAAEKSYFA